MGLPLGNGSDGCMEGQMNGWIEWKNGWMDEQVDE